MRISRHKSVVLMSTAASLFGCAFTSSAAAAQTATVQTTASDEGATTGLADIVVTAQKRSERLQDVPIAIAAATSAALEANGIKRIDDLVVLTPGLNIQRQFGATVMFIRGVGTQNGSMGEESNIATYVDGVYQVEPASNSMNFNNIDRVEVLKGPQGTLFGRNATGGLINIVTKDPTHTPTFNGEVSYGNFETFEGKLYASTGLSDSVAGDIAVLYNNQGKGFGINVQNGTEINKTRDLSLRSKWVFSNGGPFKATLIGDYSNTDSDMGMNRRPLEGARGIGGYMHTIGFYDVNLNFKNSGKLKRWGASLKAEYDAGPVSIVSISAYRGSSSRQNFDQDGLPTQFIDVYQRVGNKFYSEELQILSNGTGPFKWMIGGFLMKSESEYQDGGLGLVGPGVGGSRLVASAIDTVSISAFADGSYQLTDNTKLTLGARITSDKREINARITSGYLSATPVAGAPISQEKTWTKPTFRVVLDHHFNDDVMLFGSYNRGFKSGVYASSAPANAPADPETIDAFEVGIKADLMDRAVRLNLSAFHYTYKNIQLAIPLFGAVALTNAASAKIKGLDGELLLSPFDRLTFKLAGTYTDGEYDRFPTGPIFTPRPTGGNLLTIGDLTGNKTVRTPKFTGALSVNYTAPLAGGELGFSGNLYHTDSFFWESSNRLKQNAHELLSGEISWTTADKRYQVRVFGRNLTNSRYSPYTVESTLGDLFVPGMPRTYGIGIRAMLGN